MRSLLYLATVLVVMALAFWAYRENYRTQAVMNEMAEIQRVTAGLREDLGVLRAEWAWLNRPERLKQLVDLNFDRLKLVPLNSDQFVDASQVAYPEEKPALDPSDPTTASDELKESQQ